jgi:hypothetical protein
VRLIIIFQKQGWACLNVERRSISGHVVNSGQFRAEDRSTGTVASQLDLEKMIFDDASDALMVLRKGGEGRYELRNAIRSSFEGILQQGLAGIHRSDVQ